MVSVAAVAYYATPYEVATKLWLVPAALTPVLFPAFAAALTDSGGRAADLFSKGVRYTLLALWAPVLALVILARPLLAVWLGPAFADHSYFVLQMIALGVFINSLAYMPSALIQATGRPDLTAGLHVLQVVPYVVGLLFAIQHWGIDGAAVVWCLRAALDAVLLFALAAWLLRQPRGDHPHEPARSHLPGAWCLGTSPVLRAPLWADLAGPDALAGGHRQGVRDLLHALRGADDHHLDREALPAGDGRGLCAVAVRLHA